MSRRERSIKTNSLETEKGFSKSGGMVLGTPPSNAASSNTAERDVWTTSLATAAVPPRPSANPEHCFLEQKCIECVWSV